MIPAPMTANRISQIKGMSSLSYDLPDEVWTAIQDCTAEIDRLNAIIADSARVVTELKRQLEELRRENHQLRVAQSIIERECDARRHILPPGMTVEDVKRIDRVLNDDFVLMIPIGELDVIVKHLLSLLEPREKGEA